MAVRSLDGGAKISDTDDDLRKLLETRKADIRVVGVGGAGNNTVSRMMQVGIAGAQIIAANTDAQDLLYTDADKKVLLGRELTKGFGAGSNPDIGMESARESKEDIKEALKGADMVFVTCGMGGGTGTGAAPVIAETAKKMGALTVGVVTMPFTMEGRHRTENAQHGLSDMQKNCDTLIVVPNDKLLELVPDASIVSAFKVCDEVLVNAVKGITELVTKPGLVNLDFADVRTVMSGGGIAMIGMGESDTENRAVEAVEKALSNPLLDVEIEGATGALVNIVGGTDVTIKECQEIAEAVSSKLGPDANFKWGAQISKDKGDSMSALLIITGVKAPTATSTEIFSKNKQKEIEKILGIEFV